MNKGFKPKRARAVANKHWQGEVATPEVVSG